MIKFAIVSVDYVEGDISTYKGVYAKSGDETIANFYSANFNRDIEAVTQHCKCNGYEVMASGSVGNYESDVFYCRTSKEVNGNTSLVRIMALLETAKNREVVDPAEVAYLEDVAGRIKSRPSFFKFQEGWMLSVHKQACGHYEVFQHPHVASVQFTAEDSKNRRCTRCTCKW